MSSGCCCGRHSMDCFSTWLKLSPLLLVHPARHEVLLKCWWCWRKWASPKADNCVVERDDPYGNPPWVFHGICMVFHGVAMDTIATPWNTILFSLAHTDPIMSLCRKPWNHYGCQWETLGMCGFTYILYLLYFLPYFSFKFWMVAMNQFIIIIINLFAIFSFQIAHIYHAMAGHQKNTKFN